MSGVKGNAMFLTLMVLGLMLHINLCHAKTYIVGDSTGWGYGVDEEWLPGKRFKAGDVLVFKYGKGDHNVAVVDKASYESCDVPKHAKIYTSGYDRITLKKGPNYFICGVVYHCGFGMKIAAHAS